MGPGVQDLSPQPRPCAGYFGGRYVPRWARGPPPPDAPPGPEEPLGGKWAGVSVKGPEDTERLPSGKGREEPVSRFGTRGAAAGRALCPRGRLLLRRRGASESRPGARRRKMGHRADGDAGGVLDRRCDPERRRCCRHPSPPRPSPVTEPCAAPNRHKRRPRRLVNPKAGGGKPVVDRSESVWERTLRGLPELRCSGAKSSSSSSRDSAALLLLHFLPRPRGSPPPPPPSPPPPRLPPRTPRPSSSPHPPPGTPPPSSPSPSSSRGSAARFLPDLGGAAPDLLPGPPGPPPTVVSFQSPRSAKPGVGRRRRRRRPGLGGRAWRGKQETPRRVEASAGHRAEARATCTSIPVDFHLCLSIRYWSLSGRAMASPIVTKKMKEEVTCAICLLLMAEPVSISCGHSYCRQCINDFLKNLHQEEPSLNVFSCPHCRAPFRMASVRPNKHLGNLIEAIKEMDQEMSCEEHGEFLHLFCEDEGQLICWRCERSPQHKGHDTAVIEDVCQGYKERLQNAQMNLKQLEEECTKQKVLARKQISEWNEKIESQKQKIQSDFKNLQSFLHEEEKSYLWRLEKENKQTLQRLMDNEATLKRKSQELKSHILELEKRCQSSAQKLLQDVKETLRRSSAVKLETPEAHSLEVHTVCSVSELYFDMKKMLRSYQVNVTLDPDTAHHELILSEDRRQVTRGCFQENLGSSSRRFTVLPSILGCEGFTSGRQYFEVDVGEGTGWDLGVCLENVHRDVGVIQCPQSGFWAIRLCVKKGYVALTSPLTSLYLREQPLVVGVFLDCDVGVVSFYNMTTGSHIFTFPRASFSDTLRPYFRVYQHSPLFLPPPDK